MLSAWQLGSIEPQPAPDTCECICYCDLLTLTLASFMQVMQRHQVTMERSTQVLKHASIKRDRKRGAERTSIVSSYDHNEYEEVRVVLAPLSHYVGHQLSLFSLLSFMVWLMPNWKNPIMPLTLSSTPTTLKRP